MEIEPTKQVHEDRLDEACRILKEHYDSVRIFVTWEHPDKPNNTRSLSRGRGSYWAQRGQIQDWVVEQDELTRIEVRDRNEE